MKDSKVQKKSKKGKHKKNKKSQGFNLLDEEDGFENSNSRRKLKDDSPVNKFDKHAKAKRTHNDLLKEFESVDINIESKSRKSNMKFLRSKSKKLERTGRSGGNKKSKYQKITLQENSIVNKSVIDSSKQSEESKTFNVMVLDDDSMMLNLSNIFVKNSFADWDEKYTLSSFTNEFKALEFMKVTFISQINVSNSNFTVFRLTGVTHFSQKINF